MKEISLPPSYNYIGVFLTFRCDLACSYCINRIGELKPREELSGDQWVEALNRIRTREDLPISLQGGEPCLHKDFYQIANELYFKGKKLDLLTNGLWDVDEFVATVDPAAFKRVAPYASIRFSLHERTDVARLLYNAAILLEDGYSVGIWGLDTPRLAYRNQYVKSLCYRLGIDFRLKEYLDATHGNYKYPDAVKGEIVKPLVYCRPSEVLIAPDGLVYRCHSDLYAGENSIGSILDEELLLTEYFIECRKYGLCNYCDQKIKTNRLQEYGHTSVKIKFVD